MREFRVLCSGAALALAGLASYANAQCSTANGGVRYSSFAGVAVSRTTGPVTSAITVPDSGTVASLCVDLNSVTSSGRDGFQSMLFAAFLLTSPDGNGLVLLSATGDGVDGDDIGDSGSGLAGLNITISDSAFVKAPCGNAASCNGQSAPTIWPNSGSIAVEPGSYWMEAHGASAPLGSAGNWPQADGSQTLASAMNGAQRNGAWTLTLIDTNGDPISVASWDIVISTVAAADTSTSLSSSLNPSFTTAPNGMVTLTATVTSGSGPLTGTVAFTDNGTVISGCGAATLSGAGSASIAQCTTTFTTEGAHALQAAYSGAVAGSPGPGFAPSASSILNQFVKNHSTFNSGQYCNAGAISFPAAGPSGPIAPYPSVVNVGTDTTALSNSVQKVIVTLNGLTSSYGVQGSEFLLVAPDGVHNVELLSGSGSAGSGQSTATVVFDDASNTPAPNGSALIGGTTYEPTDRNLNASGDDVFVQPPSPAPQIPASINHAQTDGNTTLTAAFDGVNGNGDWSLFVNGNGQPMSVSGGWCLDFAPNTGAATTTGVRSSKNPALAGDLITVTATVQNGGNAVTSGSVTFTDGNDGAAPAGITGSNTVALDLNGQAAISTSALAEGDHRITATYNGTGAFNLSSGILYQRVDNATTSGPPNGSQVQFCNPGAITLPAGGGAASPNPSNILVTTLPGTVASVSVQLENFQVQQDGQSSKLASLLVGPLGANLDFFSGTGGGAALAQGLYSFADTAPGLAPQSQFPPGTYQATDYDSSETFTPSPSNFEMLPAPPYNRAAPAGGATFAGVFGNANANAIWSLYFNQNANSELVSGATSGWCVTFSVNPPELAATETPTGLQVVQGSSASVRVDVQNPVGPGAAGGAIPLTVNDTFPAGLTPTGGGGSGWSCGSPAGQSISCTSSEFIPPSSDFDTLTLVFSVPANATPGQVNNTAVVSGSGLETSLNSNALGITILAAAMLAVSTSPVGGFTEGQTAEWDVTVSNTAPSDSSTIGTTTVVDTLPTGFTLSSFASVPGSPGWTCGSSANIVTCTSNQGVGAGAAFSRLQLFVNVPVNSPASATNNVVAYGGGDMVHTSAVNGATASASVSTSGQMALPPTISNAFGANVVGVGATVALSLTLQNPNAQTALTGVDFADSLPEGLAVAPSPGLVNQCGGAVGAAAGATTITLFGGTLSAAASCTISLTLQATAPGTLNNTTGLVSAGQTLFGSGSNTASLEVVPPPAVSAAFGAPSIPLNGTNTLTFTFSAPAGATGFLNIGLTDQLPAGLTLANPANPRGNCISGDGAVVSASPGQSSISITALNLVPAAGCAVSVDVAGTSAGSKLDTTANLTAQFDSGGGTLAAITGAAASATIAVVAPPSIGAAFTPQQITSGDSASLTFTIANPAANTVPLTGIGFVDSLPAGLAVFSSSQSACGGVATTNPGTGIILSGATLAANATCQFSITVASLAAGNFLNTAGPVTAVNSGAGNTAAAALNVTAAPPTLGSNAVAINPAAVNFSYSAGAPAVTQSQTVQVTAGGSFSLTAAVAPGASWLAATVSGTSVTITANAAGLAAGSYQGSVLLAVSFQSSPINVPVTLVVTGAPALVVSAQSLEFTGTQGAAGASSSQSILLSGLNGNVGFTLSVDVPWLSVTANATQTPATLAVTVTPGSMPIGTYNASIQIAAVGASNSPLSVPVTLRIATAVVTGSAVFENSASFLGGPGAPNTIMALFGNFACSAQPGVLVNASAVEVISSTASQVTFTLPAAVEGASAVTVAVDCNGSTVESSLLTLAAVSPGIYTLSMTGSGQGAVVNQDGTVNGASHPAPLNSYLSIYGTGFGPYLAPSADGLQRVSDSVQAFIGGKPAAVQFAGHAPDSTLGLQQINVLVPSDAPTGTAVPVELVVNGASTQSGVTVAITAK